MYLSLKQLVVVEAGELLPAHGLHSLLGTATTKDAFQAQSDLGAISAGRSDLEVEESSEEDCRSSSCPCRVQSSMALDFGRGQMEAAGDWGQLQIEEHVLMLPCGPTQGRRNHLHCSVLVETGLWWRWNRLCWLSLLGNFRQGPYLYKKLVAGEPLVASRELAVFDGKHR